MGQTKAQEAKRGRPARAGSRSARISWYWTSRHTVNMTRRAFRTFMRVHRFAQARSATGHDCSRCHEAGLSCARAHGDIVAGRYAKMLEAFDASAGRTG